MGGEACEPDRIGSEMEERGCFSNRDQEERLLCFYLGGWWKHFWIPALTHLWPHTPPQAPELVQNLSCPILCCLRRVGESNSQQKSALFSSGAVPSGKWFRKRPELWSVAGGTGVADWWPGEIRALGPLLILPQWWGGHQPWQSQLFPSLWRRPPYPQTDWRSTGKLWGDIKLKCERLKNLLHRACIWFWLFNLRGVTFEHWFGLLYILHVKKKKY